MARNGSGVYSKPSGTTAVTSTPISSSDFNTLADDLAADNNVARPVVAGGTGATSASAARTALGVGTIATQASDSVDIDGGAIDGTPIGDTTPSTGDFTSLNATGAVIITNSAPIFRLNDSDVSGYGETRMLGATMRLDVDPTNVDASSMLDVYIDGSQRLSINSTEVSIPIDLEVTGEFSATGLGGSFYAVKSANTIRASTATLVDDDHLTLTLPTGRFMFEANIFSTAGAGALELGWTVPASTSMEWGFPTSPGPTSLDETDTLVVSDTAVALKMTCLRGFVRILTAGTFALRWAQDTSNAADTTLVINSAIMLRKVGN